MTVPEPMATRREVDQLRQELLRIDDHGTRGVGSIQLQLTELVKDVTEVRNDVALVKTDVAERFDKHHREHEKETRDRVSGRRWLIGIGLTTVMAMTAVIALLVDVVRHVVH